MQEAKDLNNLRGNDPLPLVQSYNAWWNMAGFDQAVSSEAVNWLEEKASQKQQQNESPPTSHNTLIPAHMLAEHKEQPNGKLAKEKTQNNIHHIESEKNKSISDETQWPKNISDFHKAIETGIPLPGNNYGDTHIPPRIMKLSDDENIQSDQQKTIMLISDYPNEQDIAEKSILSGKQNILTVNMMTACGFQNEKIYCSSLASTRPLYDELPEQDLPAIHALMRHHISLLKPDAIISLGSAACNALLGAQLMKSRENLHYFNYNNINSMLITTFHPRSLLAKPQLKRQAWQDLQVLIKKDIL